MNNQNFYLRLIALLLIIMAVFFYNGTVKDKEQAQDIADLTAKTESLEKQQDQILTALKETYEEQKTAAESNASSDVSSEADNKSEKDSAEDKENADQADSEDADDSISTSESSLSPRQFNHPPVSILECNFQLFRRLHPHSFYHFAH